MSLEVRRRRFALAGLIIILAVVYAGSGRLGQLTAIPPGHVTLIWPASGLALAAVLLFGRRLWPGIWLGSFLVNNWVEYGAGHTASVWRVAAASAVIATGATAGTLLGAALLERTTSGDRLLDSVGGVMRLLLLGAMVGSTVSPTIGVTSLCATGIQPWSEFGASWWTWWLGDTAGVLVVAPLLLAWRRMARAPLDSHRRLEAALAFALLLTAGGIAFWGKYPLLYAVVPVLVWISFRFGFHGATVALLLVSIVAIAGTVGGTGPFVKESLTLDESLLMAQLFLGVVAATTLLLTAAFDERRRVERELRVAHDELDARIRERTAELASATRTAERSNNAKSSFLANMSHELRTPMNAVLGFAQLLDRDSALGEEQRRHISVIISSGEHLLGLINDVLSIAQIEAGKAVLNEAPFDLVRMLDGLEAMMRLRAEAKGVGLRFEIAPSVPATVVGDEGKVRQILLNLLGNAVKFTDVGEVRLRANWRDDEALFVVEDTGPGMGDREIKRLFEPFYQTAGGKRREGTGLGLSIARDFARLMGGDVSVLSAPGSGAAFMTCVRLRRAGGEATASTPPRVARLAGGGPAPKVLVVDDDEMCRLPLVTLLDSVGFDVREARGGREALDLWESWRPEFIWMDLRMPEVDGFDVVREIRSREAASGQRSAAGGGRAEAIPSILRRSSLRNNLTKVVALTAGVFESDRNQLLGLGFDGFVVKPYREETIFREMAEQLGVSYDTEASVQALAPIALDVERLGALRADLRTALHEAVVAGDPVAAAATVEQIAASDAGVAAQLRVLLRNYRFDDVQRLLEGSVVEP